MKVFIIFLMLVGSSASAKNSCWCVPTTGKDYIGEARQRNWLGFTVHWVCDYECRSSDSIQQPVKGTYKKFYAKKTEDGREGICEGMKYIPKFNVHRNDYVYMWDEQIRSFNPSKSASAELKRWAAEKDCQ